MKELETTFQKGTKTYTQIRKSDKAYIYHVQDVGFDYYEVFKRIENNRFNCISYPGDKSFGITAWCFCKIDLPRAIAKIELLFNQGKEITN